MKFNPIGIPTHERFEGEIDLPHLQMTVSDHTSHPYGIQWQRDWKDASYPVLVQTVAHVAFEVGKWARNWSAKKSSSRPIRKIFLTTKSTKNTKGHK